MYFKCIIVSCWFFFPGRQTPDWWRQEYENNKAGRPTQPPPSVYDDYDDDDDEYEEDHIRYEFKQFVFW